MNKKYKRIVGVLAGMIAVLLLAASLFTLRMQKTERDRKNAVGVFMWDSTLELYNAIENYAQQLNELLDLEVQTIKVNGSGYVDFEKKIKTFKENGGQVLINVLTENVWEILQACEKNDIYLLQLWEMPEDTDTVDRLNENPHFLGWIINDEKRACKDMAEALKNAGSSLITIMTSDYGGKNNNVHHIRNLYFEEAMDRSMTAASLEISDFKDGVAWLKKSRIQMDGMLSSIGFTWDSLANIFADFDAPRVKTACFDMDSYSEENFRSGNLVMVSCGQQNLFALAVVYAAAFADENVGGTEHVELICPYLEVTSLEEYHLYEEMCVKNMCYSAESIKEIYESLRINSDLVKEYAENYSMEWLTAQKEN